MNKVQPFVPHGEATKAMQPRQGAFNDPPGAADATAVRGTPLGELRGDPAAFEVIPMRLRVIPPVPLNQLGLAGRAPGDVPCAVETERRLGSRLRNHFRRLAEPELRVARSERRHQLRHVLAAVHAPKARGGFQHPGRDPA